MDAVRYLSPLVKSREGKPIALPNELAYVVQLRHRMIQVGGRDALQLLTTILGDKVVANRTGVRLTPQHRDTHRTIRRPLGHFW
jgi:diaminopimelate decarboxylase